MKFVSEWFTTRDGTKLHYISTSNFSDESKKPCTIILHGWSSSSLPFLDLGKELARNGFKVAIIDLRGHGKSTISNSKAVLRDSYIKTCVSDLYEFIASYHLDEVNLVGYSMGGVICQLYVARYPGKIQKIVLLSSSWRFTLPWYLKAVLIIPSPIVARAKGKIAVLLHLLGRWKDFEGSYRLLADGYKRADIRIMKASLRELEHLNIKKVTTGITKPIMLFSGVNDPLVKLEDLRDYPVPVSKKTIVIAPNLSHLAFFHSGNEGIKRIISFITKAE
ncbi:MAG: alpha/beta hydrolase [Candidatus Hodarchaeales archaeon]